LALGGAMGLCYVCRSKDAVPFELSDKDLDFIAKVSLPVCQKDPCKALAFAVRFAFMYKDYPDRYLHIVNSYRPFSEVVLELKSTFDQIVKRKELLCNKHGIIFNYPKEHAASIENIIKDYKEKYEDKT
jgi:hypothetical protein